MGGEGTPHPFSGKVVLAWAAVDKVARIVIVTLDDAEGLVEAHTATEKSAVDDLLDAGGDASAHCMALDQRNWQRSLISFGIASITACYRSHAAMRSKR